MKNVKRYVAIAMIPTLFPLAAFAQEVPALQTAAPATSQDPQPQTAVNDLWERAKKSLLNSNLKIKVNIPTVSLARGLDFKGHYQFRSEESVAGKFSGVDYWEVGLNAYSALFDITDIDLGVNVSRQVTFIRQYNTRMESYKRLPYDPITKIPRKSSTFFTKTKNPWTGEMEDTFEKGDFVAYRAPMTLSLGKSFSHLMNHFHLSAGINYVVSGEFDVHVFVMGDNLVRVKLILAKDKTIGGSVGLSLFGFTGPGQIVIDKILDGKLIEAYYNRTKSEAFTGDYVFNLNTEEGREQYDKLVGSKLNAFNKKMIKEQLKLANPFASDDKKQKAMLASFDEVNDISNEDLNKPMRQRRVIKVANIANSTVSETTGMRLNLLKILRFGQSDTKANSGITIFAKDASGGKDLFRLDSTTKQDNFRFVVWGGNNSKTSSLLTQVDANEKPTNFIGLQTARLKERKRADGEDIQEYLQSLKDLLPDSIYNSLDKPNWGLAPKDNVKDLRIEEDIIFNEKLFSLPINISKEQIEATLRDILSKHRNIESIPMGAQQGVPGGGGEGGAGDDPRMKAFQMKKYLEAYDGWELTLIPSHLAVALHSGYSYEDRFNAIRNLNNTVPLFNEIQGLLLMKLIPEPMLEKILMARLVMSARGKPAVISNYPSVEGYNTTSLFREILNLNGYASNRSYNLRYYIKEDGSLYSLEEIMLEKK